MYAIIDIETTGGSPKNGRITEIAILLHDGKEVVKRYSTLINPQCTIPYYITQLTGISNEMVANAPTFYEVAKEILEITKDAVFVAHNVNFDYSFVREAFKDLGYNYTRKTLCTVRLSRTAFAGLPSYSLGKLCDQLNIRIKDRHRAMGDAEATAILFGMIVEKQKLTEAPIKALEEIKKGMLPPLLPEATFQKLKPNTTGVYYFHNEKGDVLYVGKSKDIRKRVLQHFSALDTRKSIQLHQQIADISFENTGSELLALLLESEEIKRIKPIYNSAQKRTKALPSFGVFQKFDEQGYIQLYIKQCQHDDEPLRSAENIQALRNFLYQIIEKHLLCQSKCGLYNLGGACFDHQLHKCKGACVSVESSQDYNLRVEKAIQDFSLLKDSFFIADIGRQDSEQSLVWIERGRYKGFGYLDSMVGLTTPETLKMAIKRYSHNDDIEKILVAHLRKNHTRIPYIDVDLKMA